MSFTLPFLLDPVFFRTSLPYSGSYHLVTGGMPLHDAVGINCEKGAPTVAGCTVAGAFVTKGTVTECTVAGSTVAEDIVAEGTMFGCGR